MLTIFHQRETHFKWLRKVGVKITNSGNIGQGQTRGATPYLAVLSCGLPPKEIHAFSTLSPRCQLGSSFPMMCIPRLRCRGSWSWSWTPELESFLNPLLRGCSPSLPAPSESVFWEFYKWDLVSAQAPPRPSPPSPAAFRQLAAPLHARVAATCTQSPIKGIKRRTK